MLSRRCLAHTCVCLSQREANIHQARTPRLLARLRTARCLSTREKGRDGEHARTNTRSNVAEADFNFKKVLLLRKVTRYEFERHSHGPISEAALKHLLTEKGSDYKGLVERYDEYNRRLDQVHEEMVKRGLDVKVARRQDYTLPEIENTNAIFSAGGDGTFLMAAAKVLGHDKPVIGINTDPVRSEGKLCLSGNESNNFPDSLDKLLNGKFKWAWRNRIRIILYGNHKDEKPVNLHDQELMYPEYRYWEHVRENEMYFGDSTNRVRMEVVPPRVLPILALNEVFIGESLAARVSYYEMSIDDSPPQKQKSSGVTVCTGTGSTSWFFNINHVPACSIKEILKTTKDLTSSSSLVDVKDDLCEEVASRFNKSLTFDPSDLKMAYAVRDPVATGIFQVTQSRGFCNKMTLRSRMWDAWVGVDGGLSFHFNDGARVTLEMHDEDALRCVRLE